MGLFWTSETERKEKEIREAVNSINMILRVPLCCATD